MRDLDSSIGKSRGEYKPMKCPQCQGKSRVINVQDVGEARYRRHVCDSCSHRFTTYEITAEQFERLQRVRVDEVQVEKAITALTAIKAQLGNGSR